MPPLIGHFWPLVPLASCGRRGLLSQTSQPCTSARRPHVVVLDEDDLPAELALVSCEQRPDHLLARPVGGVRLAREHELHRRLGVAERTPQTVEVRHDQDARL